MVTIESHSKLSRLFSIVVKKEWKSMYNIQFEVCLRTWSR